MSRRACALFSSMFSEIDYQKVYYSSSPSIFTFTFIINLTLTGKSIHFDWVNHHLLSSGLN